MSQSVGIDGGRSGPGSLPKGKGHPQGRGLSGPLLFTPLLAQSHPQVAGDCSQDHQPRLSRNLFLQSHFLSKCCLTCLSVISRNFFTSFTSKISKQNKNRQSPPPARGGTGTRAHLSLRVDLGALAVNLRYLVSCKTLRKDKPVLRNTNCKWSQ